MTTLPYGVLFDWIETDSCILQICECLFRKRSSMKLGNEMQTCRITGNTEVVGKASRQCTDKSLSSFPVDFFHLHDVSFQIPFFKETSKRELLQHRRVQICEPLNMLFLQAFAGNFVFSILLLYGLKLTSAAESGIILGTVPVVIGLISFLLLREPMTWNKGIALFIATVGTGAISSIGTAPSAGHAANPLLGNVLVFGAVMGEALWTILGKAVSGKVTPLTIASLTSYFGLVLFSPFAVYQARSFNFATVTPLSWAAVVYYGLGTVGAYILWYQGVSKVPASTAGVFSGVQPVSAVVLSNLLLKEPMVWSYWVGIGSVLSAIVLMARNTSGSRKTDCPSKWR
jgi:drug/metabolite transporter (DMT)-like permease